MAWEKESAEVANIDGLSAGRWSVQLVLHNDQGYDQSFRVNVSQVDEPNETQLAQIISTFVDNQNAADLAVIRQQEMQDNQVIAYALNPDDKETLVTALRFLAPVVVQIDHDGYSEVLA